MKFKDKTRGGYEVRNIEHDPGREVYCIFAEVYINGSWLTLSYTEDGILNIDNLESKFDLIKDES